MLKVRTNDFGREGSAVRLLEYHRDNIVTNVSLAKKLEGGREGERGREREGGREGGRRWEGERGREEVCSSPYELASIVSSEPGKPEIMGLNLVQGSSAYFFVNGQLLLCPVFL